MPNSLADKILDKIVGRLARRLELHRQNTKTPVYAALGEGVILTPDAVIENGTREAEAITIGKNSVVSGRLVAYGPGSHVTLGHSCFVGARSEIWAIDSIKIGDRVLISHNVNIQDSTAHSRNPQERHVHFRRIMTEGHPQDWSALPGIVSSPIVIEDDVWINFGVTIMKGVRIGAKSIIAAGSIVTKDVPPGVLYRCEIKPVITVLPPLNPSGH